MRIAYNPMGTRIRTLVLEANGFGWRPVLVDTVGRGVLGIKDLQSLPAWLQGNPLAKRALKSHYGGLSYVIDWREALCDSLRLDVTVCNINNLISYARVMRTIREYEMIIVLHSAAGDDLTILLNTAKWFLERKGKLVVFLGNEYDLIAEKVSFLQRSQADYVCSQLPLRAASWPVCESWPAKAGSAGRSSPDWADRLSVSPAKRTTSAVLTFSTRRTDWFPAGWLPWRRPLPRGTIPAVS
jgi:hypothetical protein